MAGGPLAARLRLADAKNLAALVLEDADPRAIGEFRDRVSTTSAGLASAIDFPAVPNRDDQDHEALIFNRTDDPESSYSVAPKPFRSPGQSLTKTPRVSLDRNPVSQKTYDTTSCGGI
jgi:hypothetical protein